MVGSCRRDDSGGDHKYGSDKRNAKICYDSGWYPLLLGIPERYLDEVEGIPFRSHVFISADYVLCVDCYAIPAIQTIFHSIKPVWNLPIWLHIV